MSCARRPRSAVALGLKAGTRPKVGFTVATPHANDGKRSDPPMSLPWWIGPNPIAAAAAAPPEEPPGDAASSHGLRVRPRSGLSVVPRMESSGVLVRPTMIAPASSRLRTTGEWSGATRPASAGRPFVVACPATSMFSLMVTGTPCSGPSDLAGRDRPGPAFSLCARRASSEQSATIALMRPLCAAIRPSTDSVTSAHDTSRARIIAASSTALALHKITTHARTPRAAVMSVVERGVRAAPGNAGIPPASGPQAHHLSNGWDARAPRNPGEAPGNPACTPAHPSPIRRIRYPASVHRPARVKSVVSGSHSRWAKNRVASAAVRPRRCAAPVRTAPPSLAAHPPRPAPGHARRRSTRRLSPAPIARFSVTPLARPIGSAPARATRAPAGASRTR